MLKTTSGKPKESLSATSLSGHLRSYLQGGRRRASEQPRWGGQHVPGAATPPPSLPLASGAGSARPSFLFPRAPGEWGPTRPSRRCWLWSRPWVPTELYV